IAPKSGQPGVQGTDRTPNAERPNARPGTPEAGGARLNAVPHLVVEPAVIHPPQTVRAVGSGFAPRTEGRLILAASGRQVLERFVTDARGGFELKTEVPVRPPNGYWIDAVVKRPLGGWRASDTLQKTA